VPCGALLQDAFAHTPTREQAASPSSPPRSDAATTSPPPLHAGDAAAGPSSLPPGDSSSEVLADSSAAAGAQFPGDDMAAAPAIAPGMDWGAVLQLGAASAGAAAEASNVERDAELLSSAGGQSRSSAGSGSEAGPLPEVVALVLDCVPQGDGQQDGTVKVRAFFLSFSSLYLGGWVVVRWVGVGRRGVRWWWQARGVCRGPVHGSRVHGGRVGRAACLPCVQ
jgi:hypothetical protein